MLLKNVNKGIASLEKVLPTVQVKAWKIWNDKSLQYPAVIWKLVGTFITIIELKYYN